MTKSLTILNSVNAEGRVETFEQKLEALEVVLLGLIKESISLSGRYSEAVGTDAFASSLEGPARSEDCPLNCNEVFFFNFFLFLPPSAPRNEAFLEGVR